MSRTERGCGLAGAEGGTDKFAAATGKAVSGAYAAAAAAAEAKAAAAGPLDTHTRKVSTASEQPLTVVCFFTAPAPARTARRGQRLAVEATHLAPDGAASATAAAWISSAQHAAATARPIGLKVALLTRAARARPAGLQLTRWHCLPPPTPSSSRCDDKVTRELRGGVAAPIMAV